MTEYINKETVLSKCDDIWNAADETTQTGVDTINTIYEITDFIESLPTADVQPVKCGKWIMVEDLKDIYRNKLEMISNSFWRWTSNEDLLKDITI